MKVRIDVLKAPWPSGAKVGDVVEMDSITPAFVNKGAQVGDEVEDTVSFAEDAAVNVLQEVVVGVDVTADEALQAVQEAGDTVDASDRAAMEAEAKALGVSFRSNTPDGTLAERIAQAKAAQTSGEAEGDAQQ